MTGNLDLFQPAAPAPGSARPIPGWAQGFGFESGVQAWRTIKRFVDGERLGVMPPRQLDPSRKLTWPDHKPEWLDLPPRWIPVVPRAWLRKARERGYLEIVERWPNGCSVVVMSEAGKAWAARLIDEAGAADEVIS